MSNDVLCFSLANDRHATGPGVPGYARGPLGGPLGGRGLRQWKVLADTVLVGLVLWVLA